MRFEDKKAEYRLKINISDMIRESKKTYRQLEQETGIQHSTIASYAGGVTMPNPIRLPALCRACGWSLREVYQGVCDVDRKGGE